MESSEKLEAIIEAALAAAYDHLHPYDTDSPRRKAFFEAGQEAAKTTFLVLADLS